MTATEILLAGAITLLAGVVKGAIGFAMPMIMMSAFGSFLPATTALALLVLPTLVTNIAQAFRQGPAAAWASTRRYGWHIAMVVVFIGVSAPFAARMPQAVLYLALGAPIAGFALWQLAGRPLTLAVRHRRRVEIVSGIIGGLYGGISGIWGPPLIVYLLSIGAPKLEQVRVQGVVFLVGAVALLAAHLRTGVLDATTLPLSAAMAVPAMAGMAVGMAIQDRLPVERFRRWTLVALVLTAGNLVRRGIEML